MTGRAELVDVPLSRMEWLALCCWASGMQIRQTAYSLNVTPNTAKSYIGRARAKQGTHIARIHADPGPAPYWPKRGPAAPTRSTPPLTTKETP